MNLQKNYRSDFSSLVLLSGIFLLARILFILLMPHTYSKDLYAWLQVIDMLKEGKNPYTSSGLLNWPPFWMQMLFAIHKVSFHTSISDTRLIQIVLITAEAVAMLLTYCILKRFFNIQNASKILLIAWALNPIAILLSCQHCNFDIFVGLWILLFAMMMLKFFEDRSPLSWLMACFFLGIGVLTKTVPLILSPLLLIGIQKQHISTKLFGFVLLLTPVVLGMSIIYALAPEGVKNDVIGYRSLAGWYGITGILGLLTMYKAIFFYTEISPLIFVCLMLLVARHSLKTQSFNPQQFVKIILLLLIAIPTFGPGYSPPYILWYMPLMIILYSFSSMKIRSLLIVGYIIICVTYLTEYAFLEGHGAFLVKLLPTPSIISLGNILGGSKQQVLIRLPMFIWYIILFINIVPVLWRNNGIGSAAQ